MKENAQKMQQKSLLYKKFMKYAFDVKINILQQTLAICEDHLNQLDALHINSVGLI